VRINTLAQGTTPVSGPPEIAVVRSEGQLERLGIRAPVRFRHEFGVVLLMGPHDRTGYRQVIEAIHATVSDVRVVAFEVAPEDGGEPARPYRTYTLWIVPNSAYRSGVTVTAVTPDDTPIARTVLP